MKKQEKQEQLSRELLKVLRTEVSYRRFSEEQAFQKQIGEEIGRLRRRKKLTVAELAQRIGKKESEVIRMEKGEFKQYTTALLLKIAEATGTSLKVEYV